MRSPVRDLVSFADVLRARGLTVTPDQVSDMARAMTLIDPATRGQVHAALRSLAITDPSQRAIFDEEFDRFFTGAEIIRNEAEQHSRIATAQANKPLLASMPEEVVEDAEIRSGASLIENIASRDFADLDDDELEEARRLVSNMLWQPTDFRTRRWAADRAGSRPDLRRTLHGAVGPEGDLLRIALKERRTRQRPLIIIADISGSMERYADLFLVFAHAAQRRIETVEVFTFSTHLTRITEDLRKRDPKTALANVTTVVTDWSGGTRIGDAFAEWNQVWSRRLARGGPIALILSDGWDCGDPGLLATEMGRLARSVHRVLWLNPLAARAEYEPATRGMRAVMPHIDHLLPAASVDDLRGVVRLLESISGSRRL